MDDLKERLLELERRVELARTYVEEWQKQPEWAFHEGVMRNLGELRRILEGELTV